MVRHSQLEPFVETVLLVLSLNFATFLGNSSAFVIEWYFCNFNENLFCFSGRPQPVNFDFHRQDTLRRDPTIVQPVAVRLSPDSPVVQSSDLDEDEDAHRGRRKVSRGEVGYEKLWNAAGREDNDDDLDDKPHPR